MKYVIELVSGSEGVGCLRVHIFSEDINHDEYPKHEKGKAVGAGFCHLEAFTDHGVLVSVTGKSVSLKLKPHENDEVILDHFFNGSFEQQKFLLADLY